MTVHRRKSFSNDAEPSTRLINRVASRLDRRRKVARSLGVSLRSRIHSRLTSPGGLLITGCAGFLAAEWIHRPTNTPRPVVEGSSKSAGHSQTTVISNAVLVLLVRFVQDLGMRWAKANFRSVAGVRQRTDESRPQEQTVNRPGC